MPLSLNNFYATVAYSGFFHGAFFLLCHLVHDSSSSHDIDVHFDLVSATP